MSKRKLALRVGLGGSGRVTLLWLGGAMVR